jgi:histidinol-phosphate aminotransferase
LEREFQRRSLSYVPSVTNFVLVDVGRDAEEVHRRLMERGVITRPLGPYHFPTCLRVTVGNGPENKRFLEALDEVLGQSGSFSS